MTKFTKIVVAMAMTATLLSGCATKTLLNKDTGGTYTKQEKQVLVNDVVVAFGKPAVQLSNLPNDALVIVGQKNSYVLTEGGARFNNLISNLDPRYINLTDSLDFYSAKNDGSFTGKLAFKYTKLKSDIKNDELNFFLQNGVKECSSDNDGRMGAQSFCFTIPLKGLVYPAVSNQASIRPLSKAYPVTIYTTTETTAYRQGNSDPAEKLILFPFAVAFDAVTLPFQIIGHIFD